MAAWAFVGSWEKYVPKRSLIESVSSVCGLRWHIPLYVRLPLTVKGPTVKVT